MERRRLGEGGFPPPCPQRMKAEHPRGCPGQAAVCLSGSATSRVIAPRRRWPRLSGPSVVSGYSENSGFVPGAGVGWTGVGLTGLAGPFGRRPRRPGSRLPGSRPPSFLLSNTLYAAPLCDLVRTAKPEAIRRRRLRPIRYFWLFRELGFCTRGQPIFLGGLWDPPDYTAGVQAPGSRFPAPGSRRAVPGSGFPVPPFPCPELVEGPVPLP